MDSNSTPNTKWQRDEVAQLLTSTTALVDLDLDAARVIVRAMKVGSFKKSTVLMQEGVASNGFMMLLLRGEVVVEQRQLRRADTLVLGVLGVGSVLGEMSLMDGEPRSATCTAASDIDAAVLDRGALIRLMETDPVACNKLLAVLFKRVSERLRATNRKLRTAHQTNQALREQLPHTNDPPSLPPLVPAPSEGMILL